MEPDTQRDIQRIIFLFNEQVINQAGIGLPESEAVKVSEIVDDPNNPLSEIYQWEDILQIDPEAELQRLYPEPEFLEILVDRARERAVERSIDFDPPESPRMYYRIEFRTDQGQDELSSLVLVAQGDDQPFREAYLEPESTFPPGPVLSAVSYTRNPFASIQEHLGPSPRGIDAYDAWQRFPDVAAGTDVAFIDVEQGWLLTHEDLDKIMLLWGCNKGTVEINGYRVPVRDHGTAMLGLVAATDNDLGGVGVAPGCMAFVVSEWSSEDIKDTHRAVLQAVFNLLALDPEVSSGSVILIEAQRAHNGMNLPIEAEDSAMQLLLRMATLNDLVVVEPAGNGDTSIDGHLGSDTDAIIVGAGKPVETPFQDREWGRWEKSNHGNRVHCFARGDVVTSLSSEAPWYTCRTGGTSASAAIVAGAAIVLQAIMKSQGKILTSRELRTLLGRSALATSSVNPPTDQIGAMPNLRRILRAQRDVLNGIDIGMNDVADILNPGHRGDIPLVGGAGYDDYVNERKEVRDRASQLLGGSPIDPSMVPGDANGSQIDRSPYFTTVK